MSLWGQVFAAGYDRLMAGPEKAVLRGRREALVSRVTGHVLEVGGGTGANLAFYGAGVEKLVITEPEEPMARRLERKLAGYSLPARVVRAPAEELPLAKASA
jgi:ubiquinone/menaquinone biosynthesis C-methylase UbiE